MTAPSGNSNYPTAYRIGCGRIRELAAACAELGFSRPFVVTDPGVAALPWFQPKIVAPLAAAGLEPVVWHDVDPNPTEANVDAGVAAFRAGDHDGIVLVGGGSALDAGKTIALLARNPGTETFRTDEFYSVETPFSYEKPVYILTSKRTFCSLLLILEVQVIR